jgi:hypothetical protein
VGFFDFIRWEKPAEPQGEDVWNSPVARSLICTTKSEQVLKQVENLQAVGRQEDANSAILEYTEFAFKTWKVDPEHPSHLIKAMIRVVSKHSDKEIAVGLHELLLQTLRDMQHTIDLTELYFSYGCVYQQMGLREKQLWAYHMSAEAKPPSRCEHPATPKVKALAHFQARESAHKLNDVEKYEWHRRKLMSLVPGIDLNDAARLLEFVSKQED